MAAVMVWRGFSQGTAQGQADDPGTPLDYDPGLFAPGPWPTTAAPWLDVLEDPEAPGLPLYLVKDPELPRPDVGAQPIVGPYMPMELGPVTAFGEEGQNVGRVMRFATNPVMRAPDFGGEGSVGGSTSYADEIAAALYANGQGVVSDNEVTTNLVMYR